MESRDRQYEARRIAGTILDQDFDLYAKSGRQRLPEILHDGTGRAWVSSLQCLTGDNALSTRYDFGYAAVLDDFRAGWLWIRRGDDPPCHETLRHNLRKPIGAVIHMVGSFPITHPNTAYHLGVLAALNFDQTQF